jgi:hypothetical protein
MIDCDLIIIKIVNTIGHYIYLFSQSFGDLNEIRTAKLRLLKLV